MLDQMTRQPRSQGALRSRPFEAREREREREGRGERAGQTRSLSRFEGRVRRGPSERGC